MFTEVGIDDDFITSNADGVDALSLGFGGVQTGGEVDATALETFVAGPAPTVTLPPEGGGPFTDSLASLELQVLESTAELGAPLDVSTEGSLGREGRATSSARVENFNPDTNDNLLLVSAGLVEVDCNADLADGPVGTTRITDGLLLLPPPDLTPIEEAPAPNTVLFDDTFTIGLSTIEARVVANEQTVGADDITVRGLHGTVTVTLDGTVVQTAEVIVGEVSCGVVPGAVLEPSFTG